MQELLEPVMRLKRDIKKAAATLSDQEARFLTDFYYQMQDDRIRASHQARTLEESGEPNAVIGYLEDQSSVLEKSIKSALETYVKAHPVGQWLIGIHGIGPVIAAGLLAHVDIEKCNTAGKLWRYAGLDPSSKWEKGQKRPWNASLKRLCWLVGESFVRQSGNEKCFYAKLYLHRKEYEIRRNDSGGNEEIAKERAGTVGKNTEAYKHYSSGKLPPAQIHARAKRWAVKIFLANFQEVLYFATYNKLPPKPYAISILGHADEIYGCNYDQVPGLLAAKEAQV